jgi:hypothetical protein
VSARLILECAKREAPAQPVAEISTPLSTQIIQTQEKGLTTLKKFCAKIFETEFYFLPNFLL